MALTAGTYAIVRRLRIGFRPRASTLVMAAVLLTFGLYLLYPLFLILINSFNVAYHPLAGREWGLDHWRVAFQEPRIFQSLGNTMMVWGATMAISLPVGVAIAWILARTNIPFSNTLELMFWVSFMLPGVSITLSWIMLLDSHMGLINIGLQKLPFINDPVFNIYSVPGIVWAHLMANGISLKVMLLTPAFRNMDAALEEAGRVAGASSLRTMLRVTIPLMISPVALVFALQFIRIFQSFEVEYLLGTPIHFFVYSTLIYDLLRGYDPPHYGEATVLASLTVFMVVIIIPIQRWILQRRRYTTIQSSFRPGLADLGRWKYVAFAVVGLLVFLLTIGPLGVLVLNSFMYRAGFFSLNTVFTLEHWAFVLQERSFFIGLRTTFILAMTTAVVSPVLFSLVAYILVRTRLRGRALLDVMIWGSGAMPGILTGLGLLWLFLGVPLLNVLFGTIWALLIVIVMQGNTTGTNVLKTVVIQIGQDLEDAARVSGAGWVTTYFRIWLPLLMRTLIMIGAFSFVLAAGTTSSIILISSRGTKTLSLLALELSSSDLGRWEEGAIVNLFIVGLTLGVVLVARAFGLRVGVQHRY